MAQIHDAGSTGPITPREEKMYVQEYQRGAALFQKALAQQSKSENPYQKEQFGEVMDKAMTILNQTARELKRQNLLDQTKLIAQDYKAFQENPSNQAVDKLAKDLDKAKHSS